MEEADLVLLEQVEDAVVVLLHDVGLAADHLGHIDLHVLHRNAVLGEVFVGMLEVLGGLQQSLGGNAAHIGASTTWGRPTLLVFPLMLTLMLTLNIPI